MLTAKEAADQVGKTKATILKAIKTGRLDQGEKPGGYGFHRQACTSSE